MSSLEISSWNFFWNNMPMLFPQYTNAHSRSDTSDNRPVTDNLFRRQINQNDRYPSTSYVNPLQNDIMISPAA